MSPHAVAALLDVLSAAFSIGGVSTAALDIRDLLRRQQEYRRRIGEIFQPASGRGLGFDVQFFTEPDISDPAVLRTLLLSQGSRISALEERATYEEQVRQRATDDIVHRIKDVAQASEERSAAVTRTTGELIALATDVDKKPTLAVLGVAAIAIGLALGLAGALVGL